MDDRTRGRSAAQWFCLIVGATLVVVGLLGFFAEAKFDTSAGGDPGALEEGGSQTLALVFSTVALLIALLAADSWPCRGDRGRGGPRRSPSARRCERAGAERSAPAACLVRALPLLPVQRGGKRVARGDLELLVGVGEVRLDGAQADEERLRDLAIGSSLRRHARRPQLARGERVAATERVAPRPGARCEQLLPRQRR